MQHLHIKDPTNSREEQVQILMLKRGCEDLKNIMIKNGSKMMPEAPRLIGLGPSFAFPHGAMT